MTTTRAPVEKRTALVQAATALLHEQGFAATSLADVAARAKVPLGNVYYYFRTKEALAEAVIAAHEEALAERFERWEKEHAEPRVRVRRLVRAPLDHADSVVRFGCPHGSLCQELEKLGAETVIAKAGARLLGVYIDWAAAQLREYGVPTRQARALATDLLASIQGTMLIAHTMRSADLLSQQLARVEKWLDHELSSISPRFA
jgi:AcrR family transcriptional regulator